jgi:hypothetical protein
MTPPASTAHSPDSRWWWDGERWLPAYSKDGSWWFNGTTWVIPFPAWRRWTLPAGLVSFIVGFGGSCVVAPMVMGDPGPGPVKPDPSWVSPVALTSSALVFVGLGLFVAAPIQQERARRARARLQAAEAPQTH